MTARMDARPRHGAEGRIALVLVLGLALLLGGCISKVDDADKFNSDHPPTYNFSRNTNPAWGAGLNLSMPCSALICSQEKPSWTKYVLDTLLPGRWLEFSLTGATCQFVRANTTSYTAMVKQYNSSGGFSCDITDPISGQTTPKICAPRFFMLGQGASPSEYARAQMYCTGQLKMPVLWAVPNASTGKLDRNISVQKTACYLERDQMPVVVWYSQGKYIDTADYRTMIQTFNQPNADPAVDGPTMVTTEALLDPLMADPTLPTGPQILNFTALDATAAQLRTIKSACPKCISVLALKPLFNTSGQPNLCALDYLLNDNASLPRPDGCRAQYGDQAGRYAIHNGLWKYVDLIGVGFLVNEERNLSACSIDGVIGQHLAYSRAALRQYYKPSVWYAVGMAAGPTATPNCQLDDTAVSNAYDLLISNIPALASSGIIGLAPYRFSDDPSASPMGLGVEREYFNTSGGTLDALRAFKKGDSLVLVSSANASQTLAVTKYLEDLSDAGRVVFQAADGNAYSARLIATGGLEIRLLASRYGLMDVDGIPHNGSAYTWFSGCEYYATNRAQIYTSTQTMAEVQAGAVLSATDGSQSRTVNSIQSEEDNETLFWATDGRAYAARPDGPGIKIYERPTTIQGTVQPLLFSTNGRGAQCSAFESAKMYSRVGVSLNAAVRPYTLTVSRNAEERKRISMLSCGGAGGCLSGAAMPQAFCAFSTSYASAFKPRACTQYPQMDEAFSENDVDPILLRAIGVKEGGLGGIDDDNPIGYGSPTCAISANESSTNTCGSKSVQSILDSAYPAYCTASDLSRAMSSRNIPPNWACGLGIFQCIRAPSSSYNPFNPQDSAQCGCDEFLKGANRYEKQLERVNRLRASNSYIRAEIKDGEVEWYAAFFALYGYRGMNVPDLTNYAPRTSDDNLVKYVVDYFKGRGAAEPEYATRVLRIYNDGLKKCDTACAYNDCTASSSGTSSGNSGNTGQIIVP